MSLKKPLINRFRALCIAMTTAMFFSLATAHAQKIKFYDVADIFDAADTLYNADKYDEAIALLKSVPDRDTAYVQSYSRLIYNYIDSKKYDEALALCEKALASPSETPINFIRLKAVALSKQGKVNESIAFLEESINTFPTDAVLLYNLGLVHYNNKDIAKAEKAFFRALQINPFYQSAHLYLARMAIVQGHKVHGMFAMGMYLGVNPKDNSNLVLLNNFLDNQVTDETSIASTTTNAASKVDQLIRAKIVTEDGFKSIFPTKAPVVQQFELLFSQLANIPANTEDPYVKFYLPVYQKFAASGIEPFIYHILTSSKIEAVPKWKNKHEKEMSAFFTVTNEALKKNREYLTAPQLGFKEPVNAWFNEANQVSALGAYRDEQRTGKWMHFHPNSLRKAEGMYNDKGEKTGTWQYYHPNGKIKSIENYETGEVTVYSPKGGKEEHFFLKDDMIDGDVELFYEQGPVREKLKFTAGKRDGKRDMFFPNGALRATYHYKSGEVEGPYLIKNAVGTLLEESTYKAGKFNGVFKSYHANGKLEGEGSYKDGVLVGQWKFYRTNGALSRTGSYNDKGEPVGAWKYYDVANELMETRNFDNEGRYHGEISYYSEGKVYATDTYNKGVLVKETYYKPTGEVLASYGSKDGTFVCKSYYNTGQLRSEGKYVKGKAEGPWKFYNRFGVVTADYLYQENSLHGKAREYYPSGELKVEAEYADGELHGYYTEYYRNGKVLQEGWHKNGKREQQWFAYHVNGAINSDYYYIADEAIGYGRLYSPDGKKHYEVNVDADGEIVDMANFNSKGERLTRKRKEGFVDVYEDFDKKNKVMWRNDVLCGQYDGKIEKYYAGTMIFNYRFVNGKKEGKYVFNNVDGTRSTEGQFLNNFREGFWKGYHDNGTLYSEGNYREDDRDSLWIYYHDNGRVSSRGSFRNDKRHGVTTYYDPEGTPVIEKRFIYGDLIAYRPLTSGNDAQWIPFSGNGKIEVKFSNGKIAFLEEYKNGLLHGKDLLYYPNGQVYTETNYSGGDLEGEAKTYYADGKLKDRSSYVNDDRDGVFERYAENGKPEAMENYSQGYQNGKTVMYKNGVKVKELNYWYGLIEE